MITVRQLFGDLVVTQLDERLTFDRLMSLSDPKRITRASTVRVPPMKFDAYKDQEAYYFNVKSSPSTTGLRHKGVVRCFKPKNPNTPLEKCECEVDCICPDYKFRFAWANKQRGSGSVGPRSLNQAHNRAPRHTNPRGRPGLCKHIIATRDFIYGQFRSFASERDAATTTSKLDSLVTAAQKRWADHPGAVAKAKERDDQIKQSLERLRSGKVARVQLPVELPSVPDALADKPKTVTKPAVPSRPTVGQNRAPVAGKKLPEKPVAKPGSKRKPKIGADESVLSDMPKVPQLVESIATVAQLITELEQPKGRDFLKFGDRAAGDDDEGEEENGELATLREIRDILRSLAGDDLPADLKDEEGSETEEEDGIPLAAARSREES